MDVYVYELQQGEAFPVELIRKAEVVREYRPDYGGWLNGATMNESTFALHLEAGTGVLFPTRHFSERMATARAVLIVLRSRGFIERYVHATGRRGFMIAFVGAIYDADPEALAALTRGNARQLSVVHVASDQVLPLPLGVPQETLEVEVARLQATLPLVRRCRPQSAESAQVQAEQEHRAYDQLAEALTTLHGLGVPVTRNNFCAHGLTYRFSIMIDLEDIYLSMGPDKSVKLLSLVQGTGGTDPILPLDDDRTFPGANTPVLPAAGTGW